MNDQKKDAFENDILEILQNLTKEQKGVSYRAFSNVIKKIREVKEISPTLMNKVAQFASKQFCHWEAEWFFSPFDSPDVAVREAETEAWRGIWEICLKGLVDVVPEAGEKLEEAHKLAELEQIISRRVDYNATRPLQRFSTLLLSTTGKCLNKIGIKWIARRLVCLSMYPEGTVGRML